MDTKKYIKGFNDGYILKQHKPKLIEAILETTTQNDYIQGLKDGGQIIEQHKTQSRLQELKDIEVSKDKNFDQER